MPAFIQVDLKGYDRGLKRMLRAGANVRPAFAKSRTGLRKDTRDHMKTQTAPKSKKWAPRAPATREKRLQRIGRGTRRRTKKGKLKKKVQRQLNRVLSRRMIMARNTKIKVGRRIIEIISKVGRAHQLGKTVGRGSKLPRREFLWFSPALQAAINARIGRHLSDAFK